jgi:hypothetical protein
MLLRSRATNRVGQKPRVVSRPPMNYTRRRAADPSDEGVGRHFRLGSRSPEMRAVPVNQYQGLMDDCRAPAACWRRAGVTRRWGTVVVKSVLCSKTLAATVRSEKCTMSERWFQVRGLPLRDAGGIILRWYAADRYRRAQTYGGRAQAQSGPLVHRIGLSASRSIIESMVVVSGAN